LKAPRAIRFRPLNLGRWLTWGSTALLFALLPVVFGQGFALTLLSQMGIMVIFALSYNILLGQGGMLSFGHAVYYGLGAFFAIVVLREVAGGLGLPVALLPLVGGLGAALCGVVLGFPTTRRAGTPFAMITLGIGEMVYAAALMFPGLFGGEGGLTGDRTTGPRLPGLEWLTFGPQLQVYALIAIWCFASMVAMFALMHTPLGRIANAVRDNPERAEFVGYNAQRVRWLVLILASFFAGIAGGLSVINFEIAVTAENVGAIRSGGVLLAAFIGGTAFFFGPVLGAVVFTFFAVALSEYTKAWQLYLGLFFVLLVLFAPGGLASLLMANLRVLRFRKFARLRDPYLGVTLTSLGVALGVVLLVELTYHVTLDLGHAPARLFGFPIEPGSASPWAFAVCVLLASLAAFAYYRRGFRRCWDSIQQEIEDQTGNGSP
jgi:branched-chain amino acid transport system permease protein